MSGGHVRPAIFERLFTRAARAPLSVEEFDELHRHLAICSECRAAFESHRRRNIRGSEVLSDGQAATILSVAIERGLRIESEIAASNPVADRKHVAAPARRLARPVAWGLAGALAAVCAALLLMPASGGRRGEWGVRGASDSSPRRDLFCYDEGARSATPLSDARRGCAPGRIVSLEARSIRGFPWVSVVACDHASCKLIDSQEATAPSVSLFGPRVDAARTWTIFTIWSERPIGQQDVDRAAEVIKARGGEPDAADALTLGQSSKQIVAVVGAGPPS